MEQGMQSALARFGPWAIGRCLVGFILALCIWTLIVHWLVVFPGMLQRDAFTAFLITGVHNLIHGCLVMSLYRACTTDPGYVALGSRKGTEGRSCSVCMTDKETRTHHCSVCKRCVRRMDHHCHFVNNCVGVRNYKYFVLLLVYTSIGGFYNAWCAFDWIKWREPPMPAIGDVSPPQGERQLFVLTNAAVIACVAAVITPFAILHLYMAARGTTTLEALKGEMGMYSAGGRWANFRAAFGGNALFWASPFHQGNDSDGLGADGGPRRSPEGWPLTRGEDNL